MPNGAEQSSTGRVCATTAMALTGTRTNDRNLQPTPLRSSLNSTLHHPTSGIGRRFDWPPIKPRFNAIREGHPGTGMFPDTTMTTQELTDTLAYLALLRREGSPKR